VSHQGIGLPADPVLYEVYVRSFADSDGDGVGDVAGITSHLDHIVGLGVDGIWLTPIFESPHHDSGYDVSNYRGVQREYGSLTDFDELVEAAHRDGLAVVLDMILAHTSIQHPWFRDHPERYIWADDIPNNWVSVFGGSAWDFDENSKRFYYHRFYREQPSLNWNNPDVREVMHEVLAFWVDHGVDGFRLDALDGLAVDAELRDEPPADPARLEGRDKDAWADYWGLDHIYTCDLPRVLKELDQVTSAFPGTSFVVEADLPAERLKPYLALADSCFAFDFIRAPLNGVTLGQVVANAGRNGNLGWALSNHDQPRLASRWGRDLAGVAAVLLLTLPGWSFIYQGDEIGMVDGDVGPVVHDRSGRDAVRHPMQWTARGGFSTGTPWLPMIDPAACNVEDQLGVPGSTLEQYRELIRVRRQLTGPVTVTAAEPEFLSFTRSDVTVALNLGNLERSIMKVGEVLFSTRLLANRCYLGPRSAVIYVADG
jgi:alpha-glucosidase